MSNDNNNICTICHDNLGEDNVYNLPECSHSYHTNCIMTWFRAGHNTCPLCNNKGINDTNAQINEHVNNAHWAQRMKYLKLYSVVSKKCRKKSASKEMKKDVEKVRNYKKKFDYFNKERKEWMKSVPENMTVSKINSKCTNLRRKHWKMQRTLRNKKRIVGYLYGDCVTNIIIPQKVNV